MRTIIVIAAWAGIFLLTGCVSWPEAGQGGMAERYSGTDIPVMPDEAIGPEHGLRFELELIGRHLDVLILEGAELCFPATVVQARQREYRIARQLQGELQFDAANDIIIQRTLLARLERQLDYVKQHDICTLPQQQTQQRPGDFGQRIHELLNADNQFAFDSSEINPKYLGRLAQAAQLLKDQQHYRLRITGHADVMGNESHNQNLAMSRARQVARYLQIFGLAGKNLDISAVGSDEPLFEGTALEQRQAQVRLSNRRVSIELIERVGDQSTAMEPLK